MKNRCILHKHVLVISIITLTRLCTLIPCVVQFRPLCQVWRLGPLDLNIRHNVISSLVTVCPSRSSVRRFLGLTSTKQRVNVTCSRPQRNVHQRGIKQRTPWSEIRRPIHCATPPPTLIPSATKICLVASKFTEECLISYTCLGSW